MEQNKGSVISVSREPKGLVQDRLFPNVHVKDLSLNQRKAEIRYRKRLSRHRATAHKKFGYPLGAPIAWSAALANSVCYEIKDTRNLRIAHFILSVIIISLAMAIFLFTYSLASFGFLQALNLSNGQRLDAPTAIFTSLATSFMSFLGPWLLSYYFVRIFTHFFRLDFAFYHKNGRYYSVKMQETIRYLDPLTGGMEAISRALKKPAKILFWGAFTAFTLLRLGYFLDWGDFFNKAYGREFTLNWAGLFSEAFHLKPILNAARKLGYTGASMNALFINPAFNTLLVTMFLYFIQIAFRCIKYGRVCKCCKSLHCFRKEITKTVEVEHKIGKVQNESRSYSGSIGGYSVSVNTGGGYTPTPYTEVKTKLKIKYYCDLCNIYNYKETKESSKTMSGHVEKPTKRTEKYTER